MTETEGAAEKEEAIAGEMTIVVEEVLFQPRLLPVVAGIGRVGAGIGLHPEEVLHHRAEEDLVLGTATEVTTVLLLMDGARLQHPTTIEEAATTIAAEVGALVIDHVMRQDAEFGKIKDDSASSEIKVLLRYRKSKMLLHQNNVAILCHVNDFLNF